MRSRQAPLLALIPRARIACLKRKKKKKKTIKGNENRLKLL